MLLSELVNHFEGLEYIYIQSCDEEEPTILDEIPHLEGWGTVIPVNWVIKVDGLGSLCLCISDWRSYGQKR